RGSDPPLSRYTLNGASPNNTVPFENGRDVIEASNGNPSFVKSLTPPGPIICHVIDRPDTSAEVTLPWLSRTIFVKSPPRNCTGLIVNGRNIGGEGGTPSSNPVAFVNGTVVGRLGSLSEGSSVKVKVPMASNGMKGVVGPGLRTVSPSSENSK